MCLHKNAFWQQLFGFIFENNTWKDFWQKIAHIENCHQYNISDLPEQQTWELRQFYVGKYLFKVNKKTLATCQWKLCQWVFIAAWNSYLRTAQDVGKSMFWIKQRRIYDPIKYLWWSIFGKIVNSFYAVNIDAQKFYHRCLIKCWKTPLYIYLLKVNNRNTRKKG